MPIRVEISADTVENLAVLLSDLRVLGMAFAVDNAAAATFQENEEAVSITADVVVEEPVAAEPPKKKRGRPPLAKSQPKAAKGDGAAKVKPLPPEEDDPLAADSGEAEEEEKPVADDSDPFEDEAASAVDPDTLTPEALIGAATDKLRDLFKLGAAGNEGVRKLREKYGIRYFHEVPAGKAKGLWADALKLETELGA